MGSPNAQTSVGVQKPALKRAVLDLQIPGPLLPTNTKRLSDYHGEHPGQVPVNHSAP